MSRIRLQDVAEHAGVSTKTVSNVVNNYPHVKPDMRARVMQSIAELGYRPNATARRLATGRTGTLALAVSDVSIPYFAELARTVARQATARGYRLLLEQTGDAIEAERSMLLGRESGLIDGLIFQPSRLETAELAEYTLHSPVVLLGENAAPESVDNVMVDNVRAARRVADHLLSLGCRRIGFVGHEAAGISETSRQRMEGLHASLAAAGVTSFPDLEIPTSAIGAGETEAAVGAALDAGLRFDGIFCRDDLSALGTLRALRVHGLRVPEDVAVVGWDDVTWAQFIQPTLTTIRPNSERLAHMALDLLEERIAGEDGPGRHLIVEHSLVVRESAPLPSSL
jgi:DNA-binding LacI/PurR family transcriptional regulator